MKIKKKSVEERQLNEKRERRGHSSTRGARLSSLGGAGGGASYTGRLSPGVPILVPRE